MTNDRDRSIELLLRQRRQDADRTPSKQCADAETLAAWVDGSLSREALADVEQHAASCARCQALLASMAKTTPAVEARPWWRAVTARWLVPVAAVATALVVWVSVERWPAESVTPPAPATPTASMTASRPVAPPDSPAAAEPPQPVAGARAKSAADELKKDTAVDQAAAAGSAGALPDRRVSAPLERRDALDKTADAIGPVPGLRGGSAGGIVGGIAAAPSPVLPAPATTPPAPTNAAAAAPPQSPRGALATTPPPQPKAADALGVAESVRLIPEAANKELSAGRAGTRATFAAPLEIRAPQADYRWRIVPPSGIQRSTDGGVTWSAVDPVPPRSQGQQAGEVAVAGVASPMVLIAGSSPSHDVCWIVGRAGIVLVTTDGATWQRRPIPEAADLTTVRAVDARVATVTTADGRQFATLDAGATWTLVR